MQNIDELEKILEKAINKNETPMIESLKTLIRTPSRTGDEGPAQEIIAAMLQDIDLQVLKKTPDPNLLKGHPSFVPTQFEYDGRPNILGIWDTHRSGRSLILNGHIDVVGEGSLEMWSHDPWGAEVVGDRIYGRGSCDMKSGLVAGIWALRALKTSGLKLNGRIEFQSVIEEELGGAGTLACFLDGSRADGMIVLEAHNLAMTIAHAGILYFRLTVHGKGAHAGEAHLGVNAIEKMNTLCEAIFEWDRQRARDVHFPLFEESFGRSCHVNVGMYHAGDWPSMVPAKAELSVRVGFVPGETSEQIKNEVIELVQRICKDDEWLRENPPEISWFGFRCEPWYQDPDDPFVLAMKEYLSQGLGRPIRVIGRPAAYDTRFASEFGVPAISFGVIGGNAHGADEWVDCPSIRKCASALALAISYWCGIE